MNHVIQFYDLWIEQTLYRIDGVAFDVMYEFGEICIIFAKNITVIFVIMHWFNNSITTCVPKISVEQWSQIS